MRIRQNGHAVPDIVILMVLGIFAVMSTLLVLYAAVGYRNTVDRNERNNIHRVTNAFIMNAARSADKEGMLTVTETDGVQVLEIREVYGAECYVRRLYCTNGYLRELYTSQDNAFNPGNTDAGDELCALQELTFVLDDGLLTAGWTDMAGEKGCICVSVRSAN